PNPASGKITVVMPASEGEAGTIEIFNIKGELMLSQKFSGKQTIDVSQLSPGIYMVRGYAVHFNSFRKLVIR
ncbi:MAG: T9SS type A sorting domain-containing protein, partial [Bacteroidales bacterium]|nr:T9SS type A sorting domain-containing protein [Bacteroidales bacterium]